MIEHMPTITFICTHQSSSKCRRSFEVDEDDLRGPVDEQGEPMGDPSLLPIVVPPEGWFDDPSLDEDEQFVCVECATPAELEQEMADREHAERLMRQDDLDP
jgi:hypothetical protein